ncbi:MAG: fasciclin domain-containing protein, partial [Actinomycetota bacterium]
ADGDTLTIAGANIVATDIEASNGVIHVIDAVIVPPSIDPAALLADDGAADEGGEEDAAGEAGTIIEVATEAGTFTTLLAAADAAGITAVLEAPGAFTIFAPTDDAFAALPDGLVDALLLPENSGALTTILTYHALATEEFAADLAAGPLAMFSGEETEIAIDGDVVTINDATVLQADVDASNGVIHAIDTVLVPPSIDPAALLG